MANLWAIARYDLRLSDDEFWSLTPRQFAKLYDRHLDARKHIELLIGYNTAATYNASINPPETPIAPAPFMPSLFEAPAEPTEEEAAASLSAMFRGLKDRLDEKHDAEKPRRTRKSRKKR